MVHHSSCVLTEEEVFRLLSEQVSPVFPGAVSKFAMPLKLDFDQSEFIYKRWYHCEVTTSHGDGHASLGAKVTVLSGSLGKEGDYERHFPSDSKI